MNILITGAAGFIGSQLAYKLKKNCDNVFLIDNFSYGHEDNLVFDQIDFRSEIIRMDIRDSIELYQLIKRERIDYVYNMAGVAPLPDCQMNPTEALDNNVTGFVNLLECSRRSGVKGVIQASTNAIYENDNAYPSVETSGIFPTLIYPNTKFVAERFAESYSKSYGMNVVCLRFSNVYGPHVDCLRKQPPLIAYMIRELYYGRTPIFHSDGEQKRDYIYVDDLVNLAVLARKSAGFAIYNVSSNTSYSVNEIYNVVQRIMGVKIDAKFGGTIDFWNKYPELFCGEYSLSIDVLDHEINKLTLCDNALAKRQFNWIPKVQLEEGLRFMVEAQCRLLDQLGSNQR